MADVWLKKGREKPALNRHPWIFEGAIERVEGDPAGGDVVTVRDARGEFVGYGYVNQHSQITVRLLSWDPEKQVDERLWASRIAEAVARRRSWAGGSETTAYRLVYAEADLLPGLIVDRYNDFLVVQCLTLGIERRKAELVDALVQVAGPAGVYERSDVDVREQEELPPTTGVCWGAEPPPELEILENGHRFLVDVKTGQKTGFYLDQRVNRSVLARYASGVEMLDAFAYSGGFSVYAAAAGAGPVTLLDASDSALDLARRNLALNGRSRDTDAFVKGNVFEVLRQYRDQGRSFDLIVLDPPKFAPTRQHVHRASRAYKDINLLAIKLLRPGGLLFTFSCSGGIDALLFQKIVFGASVDAGRDVQVLEQLSQGPDHPVLLSFPESAYLKGLVCRVL